MCMMRHMFKKAVPSFSLALRAWARVFSMVALASGAVACGPLYVEGHVSSSVAGLAANSKRPVLKEYENDEEVLSFHRAWDSLESLGLVFAYDGPTQTLSWSQKAWQAHKNDPARTQASIEQALRAFIQTGTLLLARTDAQIQRATQFTRAMLEDRVDFCRNFLMSIQAR